MIKLLGVDIDSQLILKTHISQISKKLAKLCGFLKYNQNTLNMHHRFLFYKMYIELVILSYDLLVYGSTNKNYLQPIFIIQKRMFRKIFKASKLFHTVPLFDKANIFTVYELFMMQLLQHATNNNSTFSKAIKKVLEALNWIYLIKKAIGSKYWNCGLNINL